MEVITRNDRDPRTTVKVPSLMTDHFEVEVLDNRVGPWGEPRPPWAVARFEQSLRNVGYERYCYNPGMHRIPPVRRITDSFVLFAKSDDANRGDIISSEVVCDDGGLNLVSVATPKHMTLAPSRDGPKKSRPTSSPSWSQNLERRGGFWGDAYWYDLQLETRLPLAKEMLKQLVLALPPCANQQVLDLCAGSGRASAAVLEAYPTSNLILVDSSEQRLEMAKQRLVAIRPDVSTALVAKVVTPGKTTQFVAQEVDLVVASLAFHVLTEKPAHYAQEGGGDDLKTSVEDRYEQLFAATWRSLRPGGHVVFADHVGQLSLFKQLTALERAGFQDVDCAWRQGDSFVAGGRKPLE